MELAYTLAAGRESGFPTLRYDLIEEKAGWPIKMLYMRAGRGAISSYDRSRKKEKCIYKPGRHPTRLRIHPNQHLREGTEEH